MNRWIKFVLFSLIVGILINFIIIFTNIPQFVLHSLKIATCSIRGGVAVSTNELGGGIIHNPRKVCAYKFSDAGKSCTKSSQCQGACLIPDKSTFNFNAEVDGKGKGECQQYKNMSLNCFVEKDGEEYILHEPCLIE